MGVMSISMFLGHGEGETLVFIKTFIATVVTGDSPYSNFYNDQNEIYFMD